MKQEKKWHLSRIWPLFIIFLSMFIACISVLLFINQVKNISPSPNLTNYVSDILSKCKTAQYKDQCYKDSILRLTDPPLKLSMQDAFKITDLIQQQSTSYMNCHDLAHQLGVKETQKDPNRWKDVVSACPTMMCSNGCAHGAVIGRYKADYLSDEQIEDVKKEFLDICLPRSSWQPSDAAVYNCHHGLGHLSMYITRADISKSIQICKDIGKKPNGRDYTQTCIGGVFMSIFQPLDTDDSALIAKIAPAKTKDDVDTFCNRFTDIPYRACHRESWIYFWEQIQTPKGLTEFCEFTSDIKEQKVCYSQAMSPIASNFVLKENNLSKLDIFCRSLSPEFSAICFASAARRIVQINAHFIDKALSVCNLAEKTSFENGETCYKVLTNYGSWIYNIHAQKSGYKEYCSQFPPIWKNKCLSLIT